MISALPGLLATRLADDVTAVGTASGLFSQPCRGLAGDAVFSGADASRAAVFVALGGLEHEDNLGARSDGDVISLPFSARVALTLAGPETLTLDSASKTPESVDVEGADLMLSVVTGLLGTARAAGRDAPLSEATIHAGGRKLSARWRYGQTLSVSPDTAGDRKLWRIEALFEGSQTLSPSPAEGAHILRAEISASISDDPFTATVEGSSTQLPLSVFLGIGPENAERLASFGMVRLGDLMRIPRGEISTQSALIADGSSDLKQALEVLHAVSMMRLDAVLGGLNAGLLFERHASLSLDQIWDGATLTLPADMRTDQRLRVRFMAEQLMRLVRPDMRARVTLGQISTLNPEGV